MLFIILLHGLVIAGIVGVTVALARWAKVPTYWGVIVNLPGVAYVAYMGVQVLIEVSAYPASNNLWPLALAMVGMTWAKYVAVVWACLALWGVWRRR